MGDLIEALTIFQKYSKAKYPTSCEHDVLYIMGVHRIFVGHEDIQKLERLGFNWSESDQVFYSYRFGSA